MAHLLSRTDGLAAEVIEETVKKDGGRYFPYAAIERLHEPHDEPATEWIARLEPAEPTAAHQRLLDRREQGRALTDPVTGAPAMQLDGELVTAAPTWLPTASPLQCVILGKQIWVRTDDGTLYLAPFAPANGLSWGYGGSGPMTLAALLEALLGDVAAPAVTHPRYTADGLRALTRHKWPQGSVLHRAQLEAARDGRPYEA